VSELLVISRLFPGWGAVILRVKKGTFLREEASLFDVPNGTASRTATLPSNSLFTRGRKRARRHVQPVYTTQGMVGGT